MAERLYRRGEWWWCRVRNRAGRIVRRSTHCTEYAAALEVAAEYERSAASEADAAAEETTLERGVNDYLADLARRGRAKATIAIAAQKTGHFIRVWGKSLPLARITARAVTDYIDRRLAEDVTRFTVKKELGHLGQVLRLARYHRCYGLDVDQVIPPFFHGGHVPRKRWPTPDELQRLVNALHPARAAMVLYIVATGARLSEALRAERGDVDWTRRVVHVRGTKTERADDDVPITDLTAPLLRASLAHAPGKTALFAPWGKIHRDLAAACQRAGIPRLSPNDLRRAFGHWHRAAGVSAELVSKLLRHTTDKLAQTTYARLSGEEVGALVGRSLVRVPDLYPPTKTNGENAHERAHDDAPKALATVANREWLRGAPGPARTGDLRFRKPKDSARSRGTKLGLARARAARGVPDLYSFPAPALTADEWAAIDAFTLRAPRGAA